MKKIIIITTIWLILNNAFAQVQVLDVKGISTNPDNPQNPENPELINTFDWRVPNRDDIYFDVESDYFDKVISPYENTSGTLPFYPQARSSESDFQPSDGWELLKINFGTLMNGQPRTHPIKSPYFILKFPKSI